MKNLSGSVAIVTGASRGLGVPLVEGLARRGVRQVLVARSADGLHDVSKALTAKGAQVRVIPADLRDPAARAHVVAETVREFGAIDLLINNAAMLQAAAYEQSSLDDLQQHILVNLTAPLDLARLVLPHMQERRRGHIVNVASMAGLVGVGWLEAYSATKHGLVGFTRALRISCRDAGLGVSASVVCPGYIQRLGMYADTAREHGVQAPRVVGTASPEAVVAGVVRAIERDLPEVIVMPRPIRLLLMLGAISPRLGEWVLRRLRGHDVWAPAAQASGRDRPSSAGSHELGEDKAA